MQRGFGRFGVDGIDFPKTVIPPVNYLGITSIAYPSTEPSKIQDKSRFADIPIENPKSPSIEISYSKLANCIQNLKSAVVSSNGYEIQIDNVTNPYNMSGILDARELALRGYSVFGAGDLKADSIGANQSNTITCVAYWNDFPVMTMSFNVMYVNNFQDPNTPNVLTLIEGIPNLIQQNTAEGTVPNVLIELGTLSTSVGDYFKDAAGHILLDKNGQPVLKTGLPRDNSAPPEKKFVLPKVVMYGLTFTALKAIVESLDLDQSDVGIISIMKPELGRGLLADMYNVPFIELARDNNVILSTPEDKPLNRQIFQLADKYWYRTDEYGKKIPAVGIYYQQCRVFQERLEGYLLEKEA